MRGGITKKKTKRMYLQTSSVRSTPVSLMCIGTARVGAWLVAPLEFMFKRSSLRSFRDMIIIS